MPRLNLLVILFWVLGIGTASSSVGAPSSSGALRIADVCIPVDDTQSKYISELCVSALEVKWRIAPQSETKAMSRFRARWSRPTEMDRGITFRFASDRVPPPEVVRAVEGLSLDLDLFVGLADDAHGGSFSQLGVFFDPGVMEPSGEGFSLSFSRRIDLTEFIALTTSCSEKNRVSYLDAQATAGLLQDGITFERLEICDVGVVGLEGVDSAMEETCWGLHPRDQHKCPNDRAGKPSQANRIVLSELGTLVGDLKNTLDGREGALTKNWKVKKADLLRLKRESQARQERIRDEEERKKGLIAMEATSGMCGFVDPKGAWVITAKFRKCSKWPGSIYYAANDNEEAVFTSDGTQIVSLNNPYSSIVNVKDGRIIAIEFQRYRGTCQDRVRIEKEMTFDFEGERLAGPIMREVEDRQLCLP